MPLPLFRVAWVVLMEMCIYENLNNKTNNPPEERAKGCGGTTGSDSPKEPASTVSLVVGRGHCGLNALA